MQEIVSLANPIEAEVRELEAIQVSYSVLFDHGLHHMSASQQSLCLGARRALTRSKNCPKTGDVFAGDEFRARGPFDERAEKGIHRNSTADPKAVTSVVCV